jgi:hypothetical protein
MASTISAGTTSGTAIAIAGDTTGNLAFQTSAGTYTQTMPNATGTIMVSGNMPAFSAYSTSNQSISQNVATKVAFQATEFDTANAFDKTTNYRFQPLVAGYYQVNGCFTFTTGQGTTETILLFYKNGSFFKNPVDTLSNNYAYSGSALIYLNGSTDYLELWAYSNNSGTRTINANAAYTYFQASMVRAS